MPILLTLFHIIAFIFSIDPAQAGEIQIIDGDGFKIEGRNVRLWGIDAPESEQTCKGPDGRSYPCGQEARLLLRALAMSGGVECREKETDRYGRMIARCFANGVDLAAEMVRQGYALDWPRYSGGFYAQEEAKAEENARGMWAGEFVVPWEWRKREF